MRAVIYARYSTDMQREASIEDQVRLCREHAGREGWEIVESYDDRAISGASLMRPGIQELIADSRRNRFDVVLAESLDRLSRDQEDIAGFYKRLKFSGVRLVTLSEGEIGEMAIGFKGTMGAIFLKDLADKTRRGLRGRIEAGKSGGGLCYGYDIVRQIADTGALVRGDRVINVAEATIVRRIFTEYAAGRSPRAIAITLNEEGVAGPRGAQWGPSTINGNRDRGTGILNNELYIGRLVWNRLRYVKDPETGKRVSRQNDQAQVVTIDVPDLAIIDQDLWDRVRARQAALEHDTTKTPSANPLTDCRRPRYLLSGLIRCGCCGGGYGQISKDLLGCSTARNKGTCDNRRNIRRDALEASVLDGLRRNLMAPELFAEFCAEFTREINRLRLEGRAGLDDAHSELAKIDRELDRAVQAILDGVPGAKLKDRMTVLEARKKQLERQLAEANSEPKPLLHPSMSKLYRERLELLQETLAGNPEAAGIIRSLIDSITLTPEGEGLSIVLRGDLGAMLSFASNSKKPSSVGEAGLFDGDFVSQVSLVAGIGFEPMTFRL